MPVRVAIMQPYLFPYLGYFQLVNAVDEFWLLDTVPFIKGGWMNRNTLRSGKDRSFFTLPVAKAPRDTPILQRTYHPNARAALATLRRRMAESYARAPQRNRALSLIEDVAEAYERAGPDFTTLTEFALARTLETIGIVTPIRRISELDLDPALAGQERIIAACRSIGAEEYFNMEGGRALYDAGAFARAGIRLSFVSPGLEPYDQCGAAFLPGLSVLDGIAHVEPEAFPPLVQAAKITAATPAK